MPTIAAIACGHGDARRVRGDIGAALALEAAQQVLGEHARLIDWAPKQRQTTLIREDLPTRIISAWMQKVDTHRRSEPLDPLEHRTLATFTAIADSSDRVDPYLEAYGANLLAAMITEGSLVLLQIGTGQIVVIDEVGQTVLGPCEGNAADHHASLAQRDAARHFRTAQVPLPASTTSSSDIRAPGLVWLGCQSCVDQLGAPADIVSASQRLITTLEQHGPDSGATMLAELLNRLPATHRDEDMTSAIIHSTVR